MDRLKMGMKLTPARLKPGRSAPTSDAELVRAARAGDKRAFVEIVARHQAMVCGIALGILGDFAASEDAGQEAFLTAWRKLHELSEPERLRAWLGQIVRNAALGQLRRHRDERPLEHAPVLPDESPLPDKAAVNEEEAALVRESLAKLPETYRLPLVLFYCQGQSVRAVAGALDISEDAVKQRLARGREMLRDRMAGLIDEVLTRSGSTPIFTMTIAAAIGALAAPAAVAASVFTATTAAAAGSASTATSSASLLAAMTASKALLITAAFVTAVCIPIGYQIRMGDQSAASNDARVEIQTPVVTENQAPLPSFESSAIFAEWKRLHDTYGTTAEAMPEIYKAIAALKDGFRRRAFHAALISEWVQVDPTNGLAFFLDKRSDAGQRRQFFEEWLARDAPAAVNTLTEAGAGWDRVARDLLTKIARRVPERVVEIVSRLPKSNDYWDTKVRDAFATLAESGLDYGRAAAEAVDGPNREQALAGVAKEWAKSDLNAAITWVAGLPDGTDRNEIIRAALVGKAASDPVTALEAVGMVPAGGRSDWFATTTGARVLKEAAITDFDGTVAWLAAHPGRLGREDLEGLASAVTDRLNTDAIGFLSQHAAANSLTAILPAINSALMNDASGQRAVVWEWLKTQTDDDTSKALKDRVLRSAGSHDPALALRMAADLPRTADGDMQVQSLANSLLDNGYMLSRLDKLLEQAPERLQQPLIECAFNSLRADTMEDPQVWIARLPHLPESSQARGIQFIASAWAERAPEEAIGWVSSLPVGDARVGAVAGIASIWAAKDAPAASAWIASMAAGPERDRAAQSLASALQKEWNKH